MSRRSSWLHMLYFAYPKRPTRSDEVVMSIGTIGFFGFIIGLAVSSALELSPGQRQVAALIVAVSFMAYLVGLLILAIRQVGENNGTSGFGRQLMHVGKMVGLYMLLPITVVALLFVFFVMPR